MKTLGIGVDIVQNSRIRKSITNKNFLLRIFTKDEINKSKKTKNKIAFSFVIDLAFHNFYYIFIYTFLGSFILGAIGFVVGLWAEKFDNMASATNFIIVPLSFLSGTFYSIKKLPEILQKISEWNPFFYIIDGFRYGFLGTSDGSLKFGLLYLILLSCLTWFTSYILFKRGYKIKF